MALRRDAESDGGGAVAQPKRARDRVDIASFATFGLVTLGLAIWAGTSVGAACGGNLGAPLDDSYIHFQFARSFARLHPLQYVAGLPPVPGATSLLWPTLLVPAIWLGAGGGGLILVTWLLGFGALFGQACEIYLAGKRLLSRPLAVAGGLLVVAFPANTWFAASAMEVVPLGFLLLRSARRSAEFLEGARGKARERELLLLAFAAALLRPEGALAALCVATAFALSGRATRLYAVAALAAPLGMPLANFLLSGSATQTTTLAKWLPTNPYYRDMLGAAVWRNVEIFFGTLLDGREWSWTFIPEGYRLVALAGLLALAILAERRRARGHALFLAFVGFGILLPTTYETFLVNRLRYLWPFCGPWLLGVAALGELLAWPFARIKPRLELLGLALPAAAAWGFAQLAPISMHDLAQSAGAITAQQVSLGKWAATALPPDARVGVNDTGAISYYSGRRTFDIVGLTTRGEARYWVGGAGSRFEHYEHLPVSQLPTHFIVYPEWFAIPALLGERLTERRVEGATILGGPLMVACRADLRSLGSGEKPTLDTGARPLLDTLDVADLESEDAHDYQLGQTGAQDDVVQTFNGRSDGGRAGRLRDRFRLQVEPGGLLIVRVSTPTATEITVSVAGKNLGRVPLEPGEFQELALDLPPNLASGPAPLELATTQPLTVLHYWSMGRVL
jgi:hypothetical protein